MPALQTYPKESATHLAPTFSSLPAGIEESWGAGVQNIVGQDVELPKESDNAVGEMYVSLFFFFRRLLLMRAMIVPGSPTVNLPVNLATTSEFLDGLMAQEAIKMITKLSMSIVSSILWTLGRSCISFNCTHCN